MGKIVKLPSGLTIEQLGDKFVVSKGRQCEVYGSYAALVRGITPTTGTAKKKPAKKKPGKKRKPAKVRTAPVEGSSVRVVKPHKRVKRNAAGQAVNAHGHRRGCKCIVCSPTTRKKIAAARKKSAKERAAKAGGAKKTVKKSKKKGGGRKGGGGSGFPRSVRGHTWGGDPSEMQDRRGRPRAQRPEAYHGDVARFNGRGHRATGRTFHMPEVMPAALLPPANIRGGRRGPW